MHSIWPKIKNVILVLIVLALLAPVGYLGAESLYRRSSYSLAAKVGREKLQRSAYENKIRTQLIALRSAGLDMEDEQILPFLKQQVLNSMVSESALYQSAVDADIYVSDAQLGYELSMNPEFNYGGIFNKRAYVSALRYNFNMRPAEYEEMLKRQQMGRLYSTLLALSFKLTPDELAFVYGTQHGSMKNFEKNKAEFIPTVIENKIGAAQKLYSDYAALKYPVSVFVNDEE